MCRIALLVVTFIMAGILSGFVPAQAAVAQAAFTPNNLVVVRVGDGSAALTNSATPVFLDEYSLEGTLVQSVALPTAPSGVNRRFTLSGNGFSEGALALSPDGQYLTLAGYDAAVGIGGVAGLSAGTYNRVVARLDATGGVDTRTAFSDVASSDSVRSAVSDSANIWVTGGAGGLRYAPFGTVGSSTQLNNSATNLRSLKIFGNQLYYSTGALSPARGIHKIGDGLPTQSGQSTSLLATPSGTSPSPYDFVLLDLKPEIAGVDTMYFSDDRALTSNGGLHKWTFDGVSWKQAAIFSNGLTAGLRGLTARKIGTNVTLYATTADAASKLVKFVDDGNATPSAVVLATAATNTAFRGVAFSPLSATSLDCSNPLKVTATTDDGKATLCGTLSYALAQATATNSANITFALGDSNTISFSSSSTLSLPPGLTLDGGICSNPLVLKVSAGGSAKFLTLNGNNTLRNLKIAAGGQTALSINSGGNRLECVSLRRS